MATAPAGMPIRQPMIDRQTGLVDRAWIAFFQRLINQSSAAGPGDVTHTGALIANELIVGNGAADIKSLGSFGSSGQVLTSQGVGSVPAFVTPTPLPSGFSSGLDGQDGLDGLPGMAGVAGAAGAPGAQGPAGSGFPGTDGDDGLDGWPGPQGPAGATGPQGAAGVSVQNLIGTNGDDGDPGFPGPQGPAGATGPQGPAGVSVPSLMGWDGDDGVDGLPGAAGAAGSSGSGTLGVPIVVDTNTVLATDQGMVVPESLEIAPGVSLEIAGGARIEITGPVGPGTYGPVFLLTNPTVSAPTTWVNQGVATAITTPLGVFMHEGPNSVLNFRIQKKAAPTPPYTITAAFLAQVINSNFHQFGLLFRQSGTGGIHACSVQQNSGRLLGSLKYVSPTSFSATYVQQSVIVLPVTWLQISDDGTNRVCRYSSDGLNWEILHTIARTDFLTADEVGFFIDVESATFPLGVTLLSWAQANS